MKRTGRAQIFNILIAFINFPILLTRLHLLSELEQTEVLLISSTHGDFLQCAFFDVLMLKEKIKLLKNFNDIQ